MTANVYTPATQISQVLIKDFIEFSFRECGVVAELQTAQYVDAARLGLQQILQNLSNRGQLLFNWRYILIGAKAGTRQMPLPAGTIDIKEINYRYPINPTPDAVLPAGNPTAQNAFDKNLSGAPFVGTATQNWVGAMYSSTGLRILHIGINAYALAGSITYQLIVENSADGVTWNTFSTLPATTLNDAEWQYWQIDGAPTIPYWRVRQDPVVGGILQARQIVFGNVQQDIPLARLNRTDYFNLPNKDFLGVRSLQFWFDRQIQPIVNLWPVPNDDFQIFQLLVEQQMPDVGKLGDVINIPNRWLLAVQAMLSAKLSLQLPQIDPNRIALLQNLAASAYSDATGEERDKSPFYLQPNVSYYTQY